MPTPRWLPIRTPTLAPVTDPAVVTLHRAAIEYDCATPLAIRDADDLQSRAHWSDRLAPFAHQVRNLLTFCRRAPVTLIADEVGLGKTISAGLILSELQARGKVRRALVLAPKILNPQWVAELREKFGITAAHASGAEVRDLARGAVPVVVTTWASARTHLADVAAQGFDLLIGDEAHKLRNLHGTRARPQFAKAVRDALRTRAFRYVVFLTATPIQNRLWDLYSLLDCLTVAKGHDHPLGTPKAFVRRYVADGAQSARQLHDGRRAELQQILGDYMVRTRRADVALAFPERHVLTHAAPPAAAEQALVALVKQLVARRAPLAGISLAQAAMSSPEALQQQLAGMVRRETATPTELAEVEQCCAAIGVPGKLARLLALCEELRAERPTDWRCIVFTTRRATQAALGAALTARGIAAAFIAGDDPERNQAAIAGLRADPPTVHVIVSTDAGAEGVNLQAANVLVNYDLPWNPMVVEQRIGRVQRLASTHATVHVVNLVTAGTVEEQVVARLVEKLQVIAATVGDIEGVLESSALGDEDGFEEQIRDLVLASLTGQDTDEALARIEAEVAAARELWTREQALVDDTLGALEAMHGEGPRWPTFGVVTPRLDPAAFVAAAQAAGDGPEDAEGVTAAHPAFARCVSRWAARPTHAVRDATGGDPDAARRLAEEWVAAHVPGATLGDVTANAEPAFRGSLALRAAVAVAHDRLERLCEVEHAAADHGTWAPDVGSPIEGPLDPATLHGDLAALVQPLAAAAPDLAAFAGFYAERLAAESARATPGTPRHAKVVEHFTPTWSASVVGATGVRYTVVRVAGRLAWPDGTAVPFACTVVPLSGRVVDTPALVTCAITGHTVPAAATVASAVDGAPLLRDRAGQSDKSGRWAAPTQLVACTWTGARLLPDEVATCALTGLPFDRELCNAAGEFTRLRKLLDCPRPDQRAPAHAVDRIRAFGVATLDRTRTVWLDPSPLGTVACVHAETARLFGLGRRDVGLCVAVGDHGLTDLLGTPVLGRTDTLRWEPR